MTIAASVCVAYDEASCLVVRASHHGERCVCPERRIRMGKKMLRVDRGRGSSLGPTITERSCIRGDMDPTQSAPPLMEPAPSPLPPAYPSLHAAIASSRYDCPLGSAAGFGTLVASNVFTQVCSGEIDALRFINATLRANDRRFQAPFSWP
jgi:hypothetical protein